MLSSILSFSLLSLFSILSHSEAAPSMTDTYEWVDTPMLPCEGPECEASPLKRCGTVNNKKTFMCPTKNEGEEEFKCIDFTELCDTVQNCPGGEDENSVMCMFHSLQRQRVNSVRKSISMYMDEMTEEQHMKRHQRIRHLANHGTLVQTSA